MGIVSLRDADAMVWAPLWIVGGDANGSGMRAVAVAKRANELVGLSKSRVILAGRVRGPGEGLRHGVGGRAQMVIAISWWCARMRQTHWRWGNCCGNVELADTAVCAAQVRVALDALHEFANRLHHDRIRGWRGEGYARLGQFAGLVCRADQAVVADTLKTLGQHV